MKIDSSRFPGGYPAQYNGCPKGQPCYSDCPICDYLKVGDEVLSIAEKYKEEAKIVGEVKPAKTTRTVLEKNGKNIVFEGY